MSSLRKSVLAVVMILSFAVSACNTVSGAGKDMESAGEAVTKTAEENK